MAEIPPGGIVPVPDPSGGVGAAVTVAHIFNAKWANGVTWLNNAIEATDDAIAFTDPAPQLDAPVLDTSYVPPPRPDLPDVDPGEGKATYDAAYVQVGNLIERGFRTFLAENFPSGPWWNGAMGWLERALAGGSGINISVERQIWERDRARVAGQAAQAEAEAFSTFANRGFPLPPGALLHQVGIIRLEASRQLSAQSRDIAIKSFEAELENARTAVQQALDLRSRAVAAAGDYIKTLVLGPQTAMQLATGLSGLKTDLARTLTALYQAEVAALDPRVRLAITDATLKLDGEKANLAAKTDSVEARVRATMARAQMVGSVAAASMNGIGADARISGNDTSNL